MTMQKDNESAEAPTQDHEEQHNPTCQFLKINQALQRDPDNT